MTQLLTNLLRQHLRAGGEALLLSATLGATARTALMLGHLPCRKKPRDQTPGFDEAVATPYPCAAVVEDGRIVAKPFASRGTGKTVVVMPSPVIAEPDAVARMALDAARSGARVLVVRNTVRDAVATRRALEALAPGDPVQFTLGGVPTLHHGRFAREDRRRLDAEIERRLGRDAPREGGLVVVGTQTLEISIDCDADLLITDLAPVDVLLQRIGRLHRHERGRPAGFETPLCHVLVPADFDAALSTVRRERMTGPHGLGSVYDDLRTLAATRALIGDGTSWAIPTMNRYLVEAATHPQRLEAFTDALAGDDPRWRDVVLRREGKLSAQQGSAHIYGLAWDSPVAEFRPDEGAATRLGARHLELAFDPPLQGPFGHDVTRLVVPVHLNPAGAYEAVDVAASTAGFSFRLGERVFQYDGLGLRVTGSI